MKHLKLFLACPRCLSSYKTNNFSTSNTDDGVGVLPTVIEQKCQEWEKLLLAEIDSSEKKHTGWTPYQLKCKNVLETANIIKLYLDISQIPITQSHSILKSFRPGIPVELWPLSNDKSTKGMNLSGTIRKQFTDSICVAINRHIQEKPINFGEADKFKGLVFNIKIEDTKQEQRKMLKQLEFIFKRHAEWSTMPGYGSLLNSFGLKSAKADPKTDLSELEQFITEYGSKFDQSQREALSALLDWNRPIVAVHGPAGSGKHWLLANYLRILNKQGKRVLVISSSVPELYHLMGQYCEITPEDQRNFTYLRRLSHDLLSKLIENPSIQMEIEKRCYVKLSAGSDAQKFFNEAKIAGTNFKSTDFRNDINISNLMQVQQDFNAKAFSLLTEQNKKLFEQSDQFQILFDTISMANLNMFDRMGIHFDVIVFDHAEILTEYDCWWAALPLTSKVRLFGDICQTRKPMKSSLGQNYGNDGTISLLGRMDKQENADTMNYHFNRQYRSHPVLHEWPNRVFYKERATEPDQSVKDICLQNSLLESSNQSPVITDPLVLVDLSKLEGGWRMEMLQPKRGGTSWYNWGEAFLVANHLSQLIEHTNLSTSRIAYNILKRPHEIIMKKIMRALYPSKHEQVKIAYGPLLAHDAEVVLHSFVTSPEKVFTDKYHLKYIASEMTRAKRQFMLFARRDWLAEGSAESRQLLDTFLTKGRVCGPNELCPLENPKQFHDYIRTIRKRANEENPQQMGGNVQQD